ncbi:NAD(P)/FAD-dependent oxidoreductase [Nakamurella sp. YIM 132087]|uniref:NAD(P)/FAD-dependent oxidoreductase n=1 Tax=Nakamurella alba TaxID=2665158 RepID=A0A7K1FGJ2_9ACTN|nr:FAD-dependent oxidoreductase [Nakamurella alba]MTD13222.1 NAD(P)/FAD-dependent oxidoreductase [Nakamurella alba]
MREIVIVGGGYAGFYTAWGLERRLRRGEARVTVVDPLPYMTYQPFLPEVLAGSVEARHAVVPLRRHLRRTRLLAGYVTRIDHARRLLTVRLPDGTSTELPYDDVVVTAGAITRSFPVPGVPEQAIGLKYVEEAVAVRDHLLGSLDRAAALPPGPERRRLLTVTVVGGGFAGVEAFGEALSLLTDQALRYPELDPGEIELHLVEASGRVLPEVGERTGRWVVRELQGRGGRIHLRTTVTSAVDGHIVLSDGQEYDSGLLLWTAGLAANPVIARHTDLPLDGRGLVVVRPDLRVGTAGEPVDGAWAAGDDAAVPDLARGAGTFTVPNAQHAVRQGRLLAGNIIRSLRGHPLQDYRHRSLGAVATLGLGRGVFQWGPLVVKGFPAWLMHRGYHVLAVPGWERKIRVAAGWLTALLLGRDTASLEAVQHPRHGFVHAGEPWPAASVSAALHSLPDPADRTA